MERLLTTKYYVGTAEEKNLSDFKPMFKADTLDEVKIAKTELFDKCINPKVLMTRIYEVEE